MRLNAWRSKKRTAPFGSSLLPLPTASGRNKIYLFHETFGLLTYGHAVPAGLE
jgi:hypothetical protein